MKKPYPPIYYSDYLQLDKLLSSQKLKSAEYGDEAHDELLFIIVHQAYELWFKLIIYEIDSVSAIFGHDAVDEKSMGVAVSLIGRIVEIEKILIEQLRVLETMTPLDFLEFRDYLIPASGFQSFQFRLIENKLGLTDTKRIQYNNADYLKTLAEPHRKQVMESVRNPSLLELVEKWLERTPFLGYEGFSFWDEYKKSVERMLNNEEEIIMNNRTLTPEKRKSQLAILEKTREHFASLFDVKTHEQLIQNGHKHLSNNATLAALFINIYRDEPILHLPFMFLNSLVEMDELFTLWRYRHALMVQRMIGAKVGTGGSSGHSYLMSTVDKHRIFVDLFDLSTYLVPRSELPSLPPRLITQLGFSYSDRK